MIALRPPNDGLTIWIDSLSINQLDDNEKSWQVGLITDIYQQAYKVLAWLGPAESDDNSVMDYLNTLGAKAEAFGMDNGPEPFQEVWQNLALQPLELRDVSRSTDIIRTPTSMAALLQQGYISLLSLC